MIFTARQLQEKCQEQNVDLYMTFVDLTKAFDTVSRDGLWKIMANWLSIQIHSNGQKLKVVINSPTWEALSPEQCTLMMRSLPELKKSVWHSEDSMQMSGSVMESSLTPS